MDIVITTFTNPFSFFCYVKGAISENINLDDYTTFDKLSYDVSNVNHGQVRKRKLFLEQYMFYTF